MLGAVLYFAVIIPYFQVYPFKIPMADVSLAVDGTDFVLRIIAVVAVSLLSGLIPAILATRKNILDEITRD
jgi:ABC-type antimicrobial peptide transport system permease subunit